MKKLVLALTLISLFCTGAPALAESDCAYVQIVGERTRIGGNYCVFDRFDYLANGQRGVEFRRILSLGFSLTDALEYAVPGLGKELEQAIQKEEELPQNGEIIFDPSRPSAPFDYGAHVVGRKVNMVKLARDVEEYLEGRTNTITLEVLKIEPRETVRALKERTTRIGSYTTDYSRSGEGRRANVELATDAINGTVLMPGEEFSFNDVVGPRTEDRGYKGAKVILSGRYVDGVGGGVCQVSTTLYNAVLRAGLRVDRVRCHSLVPNYVPLSFDAMVSASSDFAFTNTLSVPVYVTGVAKDGKLTFYVYGKDEKGYRSEFFSETVREISPPSAKEVTDPTLPEGTTVVERAISGAESVGYERRIYPNGRVEVLKIRRDVYGTKQEIVRKGPEAQTGDDEIENKTGNDRLISGKESSKSG